jgi:hypothetical protein
MFIYKVMHMKLHFYYINLFLAIACCGLLADEILDNHQGYTEIECILIPITRHSHNQKKFGDDESSYRASHPYIPGPSSSRLPEDVATSTNWSGFVEATNLSSPQLNSVSAVSGMWIVPTLKPTPDNTYCSIWVGIDGYGSPSVEQIGTEHDWNNGAQQNYAWFEMYPGPSFLISGFPLTPGDVISGSVTYIGNSIFVLNLLNNTQRVTYTVPIQYTQSSTAQRKSAEWIVEAPYLNGILPLSDFGTAYFWGCSSTINDIVSLIKNTRWQNTGIQMVTNNGTPKATPSIILPDKSSFFVTWNHE